MADKKRRAHRIRNGINFLLRSKWSWLTLTALAVSAIVIAIPSSPDSPHLTGIKSQEQTTMGQGDVPAVVALSPNETKKEFISPAYEAQYEFNAIAPHWKEANAEDETRTVELRTSSNGEDWSGWLKLEAAGPLRDNDPYPDRIFPETPLFITGKHFQYRLSLNRPDTAAPSPEISDLKVAYIDSRGSSAQRFVKKLAGIKARFSSPTASAADQGPRVVSRPEWGSPDPHGGLFKGTDKDWVPEGSPTKQVFIHHTVHSSNQSDPKAVVRAIWEFHSNTRGWGDIGYNFLVDSSGSIYEGRVGGDNIVGGHVLGYNRGSLGVAVIGCFDTVDPTCNQLNGGATSGPANAVLHGLTELLAWKLTNFEVNPQGTQAFCDSGGGNCLTLNNIAGHKDGNQTGCPGNLLYANLAFIREETARKKNAYAFGYSARQESYETASMLGADTITHTLRFKNTGTATWSKSTNRMVLKTANPNERPSLFYSPTWISATNIAAINEPTVAPGSIGTFTFTLKRPSGGGGEFYEGYRLTAEGVGDLRAFYTLPVATPSYINAWQAQGASTIVLQGQQASTYLAYKNIGNTPWYDDTSLASAPAGSKPVHLATSHNLNRRSQFGATWGADGNRPGVNFSAVYEADGVTPAANQHVAGPHQVVRFNLTFTTPADLAPGTYREYFQPILEGVLAMNDVGAYVEVVVEASRTTSSFKGQSAYPNLIANNAPRTVWLAYHNTGNAPWYDDTSLGTAPAGTKPVHLATSRDINRRSAFGGAWGGNQNRAAVNFAAVFRRDGTVYASNPHVVQPGEGVMFEFVASAPFDQAAGTYREFFQPIVEGGSLMNDPGTYLDVKVDAQLHSSVYAGQCAYPTLLIGGASQNCNLSYKNTGNTAWYDDSTLSMAPAGTKPVHLATSRAINRRSSFGGTWNGDQNRPSMQFAAVYEPDGVTLAANQHIAQPGQIVKFNFSLSAPGGMSPGSYREYFQPLVEGGTIMNDPGTYLTITAQ